MKRFLLFMGPEYDANGGWLEWHSDHDSVPDAKNAASDALAAGRFDWAQVVDLTEGRLMCTTDQWSPEWADACPVCRHHPGHEGYSGSGEWIASLCGVGGCDCRGFGGRATPWEDQ